MRSTLLSVGLAAALVSTPSHGSEIKYSQQYKTCLDLGAAAKGVTNAMTACIDAEAKRWDRRLNRVYRQIVQVYKCDGERRKKIVDAQRKWLAYRQAKCAVYADLTGGTIDRLQVSTCWLDELAHKTRDLEELRKFLDAAPPRAC